MTWTRLTPMTTTMSMRRPPAPVALCCIPTSRLRMGRTWTAGRITNSPLCGCGAMPAMTTTRWRGQASCGSSSGAKREKLLGYGRPSGCQHRQPEPHDDPPHDHQLYHDGVVLDSGGDGVAAAVSRVGADLGQYALSGGHV